MSQLDVDWFTGCVKICVGFEHIQGVSKYILALNISVHVQGASKYVLALTSLFMYRVSQNTCWLWPSLFMYSVSSSYTLSMTCILGQAVYAVWLHIILYVQFHYLYDHNLFKCLTHELQCIIIESVYFVLDFIILHLYYVLAPWFFLLLLLITVSLYII